MAGLHFCGDTINILVAHEYVDIIEIKTIHIELIELIELGIETALRQILETNLEKLPFEENLTNGVLKPCLWLLKQIGFHFHPHVSPALDASLTFIRKVAIVIDIALVSYVRSHGSGFDTSYFNNDLNQLEISDGEDWLAFRCYFAKLACLDAFLDGKRVWVFDLWHRCFRVPSRRREEQEHGSKSLLARMEDFADIWGPVYTVPTSTGLIKHYGVSKGVICKVYSKKPCAIPGAMTCHFFTRLAFYIRKTSRQLSGGDYLVLTKGDLLLIGAGFCDNGGCPYTISSFTKDVASEMTVLGTKDSFWKTDSRGLAVGLSKYLGVTVSGTQKLIPQTTLKQHILDKWSTTPTRCNPVILNQYLGVEISHCTGNARRISLRELMVSRPVRSVLQSQHPQWYKTQWGTKFSEALHSTNSDDIVDVWEKFPSNRSEMADLVCRVLELLDTTGWNEQHVFKSAVLVDNEEWAVPIEKKLNSWVHVLSDTHLTGTYVITSERCIECEVPDHTIATCGTSQAFTALKTKIATTESPSTTKAEYLLRPLGERFRQIDCGQPTVLLLSPSPKTFARSLFRTKIYDCSECVNSTKPDCSRSTVYFRASTQSYRGRYKNNTILRSANLTGSQQRRVMPGIDQNSSTRRDHRRMRNRTQGEANECQHDDPDLSLWGNSQINPDLIHKHHQFDKIDGNASLTHENEEEQITHNMNRVAINKLLGGDHPNEADPVSLPKRPHAISNERDQRLPTRGARDLDQYDSRHRRTDPRIAGRSNAAYASHPRSSERISRANRSLYDGSLDNMVNYAFASEDDSDADCSTTLRRANHVPALSSPGGWL